MTKFGTFTKLSINQIFRNKRKTFGILIGIILALILIVGTEFAINHSAKHAFKSKLERIPVDFHGYYYGPTSISNINNLINSIENVNNVENAVLIGDGWANCNKSSPYLESLNFPQNYSVEFKVISEDSFYTREMFGVSESFGFSPGKFTITNVTAEYMNISIGDRITFFKNVYNYDDENYTISYVNLTCGNIISIDPNRFDQADDYYKEFEDIDDSYFYYLFTDYSIFMDIETHAQVLQQVPEDYIEDWSVYYELFIWMDRDEIIDYGNLQKTESNIKNLETELDFNIGYGVKLSSGQILDILEEQEEWLFSSMVTFLAFSLPVMALGIYLGAVSIDLGLEERKREIGLLKSRGASNSQILGYLLIEAVILGIIAGILGVLLGIICSKIFLVVFFAQESYSLAEIFIEFYIPFETILIGIGLGIAFLLIASYRSIKKISKLSIIDCFARQALKIDENEYKWGRDLILLWVGIFTFIMMIMLNPSDLNYEMGILEGILLFIFMTLTIILLPLFPFIIIISITRLITKKGTKVYDYISRVTKYLTKDLWYLINKNITRNPHRAIGITTIIALSLAFGIFISTTIDITDAYNKRVVEAEVGADIRIDTDIYYNPYNYDPDLDEFIEDESMDDYQQDRYLQREIYNISNNLKKVEGVDETTEVFEYDNFYVIFTKEENYPSLYVINISTYYNTVKPDNYFFLGETPKNVLSKLKDENSILIDDYFAEEEGYSIGDSIKTGIPGHMLNLKIVGIVRVLPGVPNEIETDYRDSYNFYIDINSKLGRLLEGKYGNQRFLIKVKQNYDHYEVLENIFLDVFYYSNNNISYYVEDVTVREKELDLIENDPEDNSINAFLKTEYIFTIMIITIGLGLLLYVAGMERKQEMGSILARGASRKQIRHLYFGEGITTLILGSILGIITGFLASLGFNSLLSVQNSQIEREFIVSLNTILIIVLPIIILFIVIYAVSIIVSKIELYKVLRLRGG
jgi:ABC-type antimicrobial peptide transport system permease subunit